MILIKSSIILCLLWLFYKVFLQRESFFWANRFYLILCLILTFLLPYITLPSLVQHQGYVSTLLDFTPEQSDPELITHSVLTDEEASLANPINNQATVTAGHKSWIFWIWKLYYFGIVVFATVFLFQICSILSIALGTGDKIHEDDCIIVNTADRRTPFSFFKYIFIRPDIYDRETYNQIIDHEKIHVNYYHSLDLLVAEIVAIVLWFNPVIWLYKRDIMKNIEYQTDHRLLAISRADKKKYQMNLIEIATSVKPLSLTTNYNQSLLKQRLLMMNSKKSSIHNSWKYAFLAPFFAGILLLVNRPNSVMAQKSFTGHTGDMTMIDSKCGELVKAIKDNNINKVGELLMNTDPNCNFMHEYEDPNTPLVAAARIGYFEIAKMLITAGADVNLHHKGDETPLMAAAANGHMLIVKYFVDHGAGINTRVNGDGTALLVAAREGHLQVVRFLISKNADVNAQVEGDGTPLICAVRGGHYHIAKLLLESGADPELKSPGDEFPMYHAWNSDNDAMVDLLLSYRKN